MKKTLVPPAERIALPTYRAGSTPSPLVWGAEEEEERGEEEEEDADCVVWVEPVCSEWSLLLRGLVVVASFNCVTASVSEGHDRLFYENMSFNECKCVEFICFNIEGKLLSASHLQLCTDFDILISLMVVMVFHWYTYLNIMLKEHITTVKVLNKRFTFPLNSTLLYFHYLLTEFEAK